MNDLYTYIRDGIIVLATASAAIIAYVNYLKRKRYEEISRIRKLIMKFEYNCNTLKELFTYEVAHEIVAEVVYSDQIKRNIIQLEKSIPMSGMKLNKDTFWPHPITISIHSPILYEYEKLLKSNNEICGELAISFPSLFRIYSGISFMLTAIIHQSKEFVRNEEVMSDLYRDAIRYKITNIEDIKDCLYYSMMSQLSHFLIDEQKNIADAISIIGLTKDGVNTKTDKRMSELSKKEKLLKMKDYNETESIFDDFREAEKGMELLLTSDQLLKYRELYIKMMVRSERSQ